MNMMREEQFKEAQTNAAYNHHLLQEPPQAKEQLGACGAVTPNAGLVE